MSPVGKAMKMMGVGALALLMLESCTAPSTGHGNNPGTGGGEEGGTGGVTSTGGSRTGGSGPATGGAGGAPDTGGSGGGGGGSTGGAAGSPDAGPGPTDGPITPPPPTDFAVTTGRYGNDRTGANTSETVLNTSNVKPGTFGMLFRRQYDGNAYAQPLYVPGLTIGGAKHNVIFVATSTNNVYAFDADDPAAMMPLWQRQLAPAGDCRVGGSNPNTMTGQTWCHDMFPFVGVTGTPVIDLQTKRMYLVHKEGKFGGAYSHKLHALDLLTGNDAPGSPVTITASAGGQTMDPWKHLNRPGLLLAGGKLFIGIGSHCDDRPYHGWVLKYDPATLKQEGVFITTPTGSMGAIWQSGAGLAANDKGVFFCVGNGTWSADGKNLSESVVRLNFDATLGDWFTPGNADALNRSDLDLTAGVILVPGTNFLFSGGKEGVVYVIDQMNLSHHNAQDQIKQRVDVGDPSAPSAHIHNMAYWNERLYVWPENSGMQAYSFTGGQLSAKPVAMFNGYKTKHPGGVFSISADGTKAGTGIIWATLGTSGNAWSDIAIGTMVAVDATTGAKLWDSTAAGDAVGNFAKFSNPTVANGKVYVTSFAKVNASSPAYLNVYGLKK
ncbi:MAG TPA: hypothetical protein VN914_14665 [Polyangia bacterium]|nr:hypothetical protein [Polyangia bacterium]